MSSRQSAFDIEDDAEFELAIETALDALASRPDDAAFLAELEAMADNANRGVKPRMSRKEYKEHHRQKKAKYATEEVRQVKNAASGLTVKKHYSVPNPDQIERAKKQPVKPLPRVDMKDFRPVPKPVTPKWKNPVQRPASNYQPSMSATGIPNRQGAPPSKYFVQ
jgi:hypothetical protein